MRESHGMSARWKLVGATVVAAAAVFSLRFIVGGAPAMGVAERHSAATTQKAGAALPAAEIKRYQVPVTSSQPSKGPADAMVTIVQWCDLRGEACKQVEPAVRAVLAHYPEQVRLVFRHFVDPTKAPELAEFTRAAFELGGKFWEARDLIMAASAEPTRDDLEHYADTLGLPLPAVRSALDAHTHAAHVMADRMFATMFEVHGVPAFFVNGRRLQGEASSAALELLIKDELARSSQLVDKGVPKDQVYAELIKNGAWIRSKPGKDDAWGKAAPSSK